MDFLGFVSSTDLHQSVFYESYTIPLKFITVDTTVTSTKQPRVIAGGDSVKSMPPRYFMSMLHRV